MPGCWIDATALASISKRRFALSDAAATILSATFRSSLRSIAA